MKITLESTDRLVQISVPCSCGQNHDVPARVWEGVTEHETPVAVLVTRIAVPAELGQAVLERFEHELREVPPVKSTMECYPLRLIL